MNHQPKRLHNLKTPRPSLTLFALSQMFLVILLASSISIVLSSCDQDNEASNDVIYISSPNSMADMADLNEAEDMSVVDMQISNDEITLTVKAVDPLSGQGVSGLTVTLGAGETMMPLIEDLVTDQSGSASLRLAPQSDYEVILNGEGYSAHHLFGSLGDRDATQISFVSTDRLTEQVFSALDVTPDINKGIVVIGLDQPNLSPAIGTMADLANTYEKSFTLGSFGPTEGNTVVSGGGGFVSFANVDPGSSLVLVEAKEGERCAIFPRNQSSEYSLPVYPGEVSIVAFTCQPIP